MGAHMEFLWVTLLPSLSLRSQQTLEPDRARCSTAVPLQSSNTALCEVSEPAVKGLSNRIKPFPLCPKGAAPSIPGDGSEMQRQAAVLPPGLTWRGHCIHQDAGQTPGSTKGSAATQRRCTGKGLSIPTEVPRTRQRPAPQTLTHTR